MMKHKRKSVNIDKVERKRNIRKKNKKLLFSEKTKLKEKQLRVS